MAPAKKPVEKGGPQRSIQSFFAQKPVKSPIKSTPGKRKVPLVIGDVDALKQEIESVLPVVDYVEVKTPEMKQTLGNKKKAPLVIGHVQASALEVKSSPKRKKTRDFGPTDTGNANAKSDDIILEDMNTPPKRRRLRKCNADSSDTSSLAASPECTISGKRLQPIPTPSPIDTAVSAKMHRAPMLHNQSPESRVRDSPELVIGKKLRVYWPLDKAWYAGQVKAFNAKLGKHVVVYDDGEEENVSLEKEKVEWIDDVENGKEVTWSTRKRSQPQHLTSGSKRLKADAKDVSTSNESLNQEENGERQSRGGARRQVIYEEESEASGAVDDDDEDDADFQVSSEKSDGEASDPADDRDELSDLEDEDNVDDDQKLSRDKRRKSQPSGKGSGKKAAGQSTAGKTVSSAVNGKGSASKKDSSTGRTSTFGGLKSVGSSAKNPTSKTRLNLGNESSLAGEAVDRFGGRDAQKFKFLGKDRKDAAGKKPTDPAYDPRTLHLPADFLKSLSGGQRQWWMFKAKHMDKVLFFKMGKFYEMFEMDAHIGAKELDLQYMKGEQPHCGFPEKNFSDNAEKLARKGYRVLVVEQTETPDQLERRRKETGSKDKVVMREVCAVITKGTIFDGDLVTSSSEASIILSVTERPLDSDSSMIGLCAVDASTSCFQLGQFQDDAARTHLCSVLTELRPVELIVPRGSLSAATSRVLRDCTRQPLLNELNAGEFWDADQTVKEVTKVYSHLKCPGKGTSNNEGIPDVLMHVIGLGDEGDLALSAFGACVFYLRQALLDQTLLSLGRVELLPGNNRISGDFRSMNVEQKKGGTDGAVHKVEPYMVLDGAALENLEVLENRDGGTHGTLLAKLDHCSTPFGRRLLKGWLARPLLLIESIRQRQIAVADLKGVASEAARLFRKELAGVPDMERTLARLHASSEANGRNASKVVMYEDMGKKQVHQFTAALRGCRSILQAAAAFESSLPELSSNRLRDLLTTGKGMPDMMSVIEHFETAFDWTEAEKSGRIVPHESVDDDFDAASGIVIEVEEQLAAYLEKQRKHFGNSSEIVYLTVGKEAYQMEVPDRFLPKVPREFEVRSSRKGCRRYWSPEIKSLLQELTAGQEQRESALKGILMRLVHKFCEDYSLWLSAVKSIAEVDVLISISAAGLYADGITCTPKFSESGQSVPWFNAKSLRHPTIGGTLAGGNSFVPNDIALGGEKHAPFILLTGPNMGGKSTLLRQVCLAVILAQVGADVPAAELHLAPVDQVFVRMGARDHIMSGQSTFLVELQETATMLRSATRNSLVALDELGRGTATSDGQAIAHAVLHRLTQEVGCRGMFSTHYHRLATDHALDPTVALCHMGCKVASTKGGTEEVTFLYTLSPGACPKSYGVNVARLAGMPESILLRAGARSAELEHLFEDSNRFQAVDAPDPSVCQLLKNLDSVLQGSETDSKTLLPLWKEATRIVTVSAC